jgi:hypothetical protein
MEMIGVENTYYKISTSTIAFVAMDLVYEMHFWLAWLPPPQKHKILHTKK